MKRRNAPRNHLRRKPPKVKLRQRHGPGKRAQHRQAAARRRVEACRADRRGRDLGQRDGHGIARPMGLVLSDVEVADAEREIDRVEIFECPGQVNQVRDQEQDQQRDAGRALPRHSIGRSLSASFRLPRR